MILTVTLNVSLDVSYGVERLSRGEPVRVRDVGMRPGGKGLNVAMVLAALGTEVTATGLVGGHRGELIREGLAATAVVDGLFAIAAESRQTVVAAADDGSFAEYDEPGAGVSLEEWEGFLAVYCQLLDDCSTVVCAGSLPGDVPVDAYATLISLAHDRGRNVVLDAGGDALRNGIGARPDIVKVNHCEVAGLGGSKPADRAAAAWAEQTGGVAVVTSGADGAVAAGSGWRYRLRPPARHGNPVGAGDAFTAGLLADTVAGSDPADRLAFATALAASAVGMPGAGLVDLGVAAELLRQVGVEPW